MSETSVGVVEANAVSKPATTRERSPDNLAVFFGFPLEDIAEPTGFDHSDHPGVFFKRETSLLREGIGSRFTVPGKNGVGRKIETRNDNEVETDCRNPFHEAMDSRLESASVLRFSNGKCKRQGLTRFLRIKRWVARQGILLCAVIIVFRFYLYVVYSSGAAIDARKLLLTDAEISSICGANVTVSDWIWYGGKVSVVEDKRGDAYLWFECKGNSARILVRVDMVMNRNEWSIINKTIMR